MGKFVEKRKNRREQFDREVKVVFPVKELTGRLRNYSRDGMLVNLEEGLEIKVTLDRKEVQGTLVRIQAVDSAQWALGIQLKEVIDLDDLTEAD